MSGPPPPSPDVVASVLAEVAAFGRDNDAHHTERARRMLNITPETGQLLRILVQATAARRILEVGTSNGYSTLWLAWSTAETDGHVDTIELAADKELESVGVGCPRLGSEAVVGLGRARRSDT